MEAYQTRVVEEKQELDSRLEKLQLFVASTRFDGVPNSEQERMKRQLRIMKDYSQVLSERIDAFSA